MCRLIAWTRLLVNMDLYWISAKAWGLYLSSHCSYNIWSIILPVFTGLLFYCVMSSQSYGFCEWIAWVHFRCMVLWSLKVIGSQMRTKLVLCWLTSPIWEVHNWEMPVWCPWCLSWWTWCLCPLGFYGLWRPVHGLQCCSSVKELLYADTIITDTTFIVQHHNTINVQSI